MTRLRRSGTIDFTHTEGGATGKAWPGIYALEGDALKICDIADDGFKREGR